MNDHGSALVAAAEYAWSCIQEKHPDVPDVVIRLGVGESNLGYFFKDRLSVVEGGTAHEVMLGAQRIGDGPGEAFCTLLHEAAHAACCALNIKDTSRQGRYHNRRFAKMGESMGLVVEHHSATHGLALTTLAEGTAEAFADAIARMDEARKVVEMREDASAAAEGKERKPASKAACGCVDRLIPASALKSGPLVCGLCNTEFVEVDDDGN